MIGQRCPGDRRVARHEMVAQFAEQVELVHDVGVVRHAVRPGHGAVGTQAGLRHPGHRDEHRAAEHEARPGSPAGAGTGQHPAPGSRHRETDQDDQRPQCPRGDRHRHRAVEEPTEQGDERARRGRPRQVLDQRTHGALAEAHDHETGRQDPEGHRHDPPPDVVGRAGRAYQQVHPRGHDQQHHRRRHRPPRDAEQGRGRRARLVCVVVCVAVRVVVCVGRIVGLRLEEVRAVAGAAVPVGGEDPAAEQEEPHDGRDRGRHEQDADLDDAPGMRIVRVQQGQGAARQRGTEREDEQTLPVLADAGAAVEAEGEPSVQRGVGQGRDQQGEQARDLGSELEAQGGIDDQVEQRAADPHGGEPQWTLTARRGCPGGGGGSREHRGILSFAVFGPGDPP